MEEQIALDPEIDQELEQQRLNSFKPAFGFPDCPPMEEFELPEHIKPNLSIWQETVRRLVARSIAHETTRQEKWYAQDWGKPTKFGWVARQWREAHQMAATQEQWDAYLRYCRTQRPRLHIPPICRTIKVKAAIKLLWAD